MSFIPIAGPADQRVKQYRAVGDRDLLREAGAFVAEGRLVVERLLSSPRWKTRSVLVNERARTAMAAVLEPAAGRGVSVYVASQEALDAIVGFHIHRGALAMGERGEPLDMASAVRGARLVLLLESLNDADNVGSLFRSAAAFGAGAVLLDSRCCDPLYRKAIRTSMAAVLQVPFARMAVWPATVDHLRRAGFTLVALTPSATAESIDEFADLGRALPRVALMVGSEGEGLSPEALASADHRVRIPMAGRADSLNVAVAAAIALHRLTP